MQPVSTSTRCGVFSFHISVMCSTNPLEKKRFWCVKTFLALYFSPYTMSNPNAASSISSSIGTVQVLNLSAASQAQLLKHQAALLDLEAKKVAATIVDVPTLPDHVRTALRNLGLPVRLFGENLANVRDRLRLELARRQVGSGGGGAALTPTHLSGVDVHHREQQIKKEEEDEEVTKYTRASPELVAARQAIAQFSLQRGQVRMVNERKLRGAYTKRKRDQDTKMDMAAMDLEKLEQECTKTYNSLRQMTLEGSQYGDARTVSCICAQSVGSDNYPLIATGSWTGSLHLWDGSSPTLNKLGEKLQCHEDRIMGIAMVANDVEASAILCTTSIDRTAKLWKAQKSETSVMSDVEELATTSWIVTEQANLKGHSKRLCRAAFHPMKKHVATTSFDYSWRLWDVESNQEMLLLQDGHWKETYGIGFHPDGSLCATTDFAGVIQLWDLRTGKSIRHFLGHAKRILNAEFHPVNGFQLASSGDDGTIKIWDLRQRKQLSSIPAHSNLVTQLRFDPDQGEYLASSSFDGTIKLWSTRSWKCLNVLQGHEGKVSGVDIVCSGNPSIVSCGFDKTLKMWR
jgi:U4/U6 small nuclear ribonucleoprotein PRP4